MTTVLTDPPVYMSPAMRRQLNAMARTDARVSDGRTVRMLLKHGYAARVEGSDEYAVTLAGIGALIDWAAGPGEYSAARMGVLADSVRRTVIKASLRADAALALRAKETVQECMRIAGGDARRVLQAIERSEQRAKDQGTLTADQRMEYAAQREVLSALRAVMLLQA